MMPTLFACYKPVSPVVTDLSLVKELIDTLNNNDKFPLINEPDN